jgi:Uma2 family endonuclease
MSAAVKRYTVAEYLALERASATKHEYFDGEIFAMAGATEPHNLISGNSLTSLNQRLRDRPCRVYPSDMRVLCPSGLRTYPDVTVVCGTPQFEDGQRDTLLNPRVLIEVLSPSTETYDRGKKFENFQAIPSLREFLLICQDRPRVEHYTRQEGADEWTLKAVASLDASIHFPSLDCDIPLAEIYAKVEFAAGPLGLHGDQDGET